MISSVYFKASLMCILMISVVHFRACKGRKLNGDTKLNLNDVCTEIRPIENNKQVQ
jgi:hypothetical protein